MSHDYDVLIAGGGLIGSTMAIALSTLPIRIAVIEAFESTDNSQPSFDDRSIALSAGSTEILNTIGIWKDISSVATPIEHIHVSDKGQIGMCRLHASDYRKAALGYVIENREFGQVLHEKLREIPNIDLIVPATIDKVKSEKDCVEISVTCNKVQETFSANLLIASDGTRSTVAQCLSKQYEHIEYGKSAIICNIQTRQPKSGWAFERFTPTGPLAMLPLTKQRMSVVWSVDEEEVESLMALKDSVFSKRLQLEFGYRLGKIVNVGKRVSYPLICRKLESVIDERTVFIGNAQHTGHPVAGQGFNLGLRDVADLAESILNSLSANGDIGCKKSLEGYANKRTTDIRETITNTDGLARLFSNTNGFLIGTRNIALKWLDIFPPFKLELARHAMGYRSDLSLLARGIKLDDDGSRRLKNRLSGVQKDALS